MTEVFYECKDQKDNIVFTTASLQTARDFVQKNGGKFYRVDKIKQIYSEPHCMKDHRTL